MAPDNCSMVEASDLSVVRRRTLILRDIELAVSQGETVAVMGPNGAGKSTLLKCLSGELEPTDGKIHWLGNPKSRSAAVRRQIGFAGHETGLYVELTALENLVFAGRMNGIERPGDRAATLLTQTGLESLSDYMVGQLSQGQQRRLAIARALVHEPPLVLLDEPFSSLDADGRHWLEQLFEQWRSAGRTACFASHDVELSRRLADRIVWLDAGRIAATEFTHTSQTGLLRSA